MFKFTVTPDAGEPFDVEATSRDITRWEGMSRNNSLALLNDSLRMTDLVNLAWFAAERRGLTELDRPTFADAVDISFERKGDDDEDDESGPTRAGR